ncbi:E3 ubiquitin-protein ligase RNF14-like protein [Dinothrombium tinctorium]|uniref:RBR-type E3 ubiquitin transferase n=1 Tax=Dinothrombium tinctorium TaxID=1965070 RepID=A0A3S3PJ08_9ACAR|nr:E3 ubiquitin-protein ligase RNF14-like protein [Dinothrombium tinctorium]
MQNEAEDNTSLQDDELLALKSIFERDVLIVDESEHKGRFFANVVLPNTPFSIVYKDDETGDNSTFEVHHLPPIELFFELPAKYPCAQQPSYLISCTWLSQNDLTDICSHLDSLWEESHCEVLFTWFSFLQNDVLNFLDHSSNLNIRSLINEKQEKKHDTHYKPSDFKGDGLIDQRVVPRFLGHALINHLKAYSDYKRKEEFKKQHVKCIICFQNRLGSECVLFSCFHTSCKECMSYHFRVQIKEGNVHSLKCPETDCKIEATPALVRELVGEELYERYDQLLFSSVLQTMGDIVYCPRIKCQSPVVTEPNEKLALCPSFSPCRLWKDDNERIEMLQKYQRSNFEERKAMEKTYGKKELLDALNSLLSEEYLEENTKKCPSCKSPIEKLEGCNKMTCRKCNAYFCWLCKELLPSTSNPYRHFNDPQSKCFNKLFFGIDPDEIFDEMFD